MNADFSVTISYKVFTENFVSKIPLGYHPTFQFVVESLSPLGSAPLDDVASDISLIVSKKRKEQFH